MFSIVVFVYITRKKNITIPFSFSLNFYVEKMYRYWQVTKKTPRAIVLSQYNENYKLLENKLIKDVKNAGGTYEFKTPIDKPTITTSTISGTTSKLTPSPERSLSSSGRWAPPPPPPPPPQLSLSSSGRWTSSPERYPSSPELLVRRLSSPSRVSTREMISEKLVYFDAAGEERKYSNMLEQLDRIERGSDAYSLRDIINAVKQEIRNFTYTYAATLELKNKYEKHIRDYDRLMNYMKNEYDSLKALIEQKQSELKSLGDEYKRIFHLMWDKPMLLKPLDEVKKPLVEIFTWVFEAWKHLVNKRCKEMLSGLSDEMGKEYNIQKALYDILIQEQFYDRNTYFETHNPSKTHKENLSTKYDWLTNDMLNGIYNGMIYICGSLVLTDPSVTFEFESTNPFDTDFDNLYEGNIISGMNNEIEITIWPKVVTNGNQILYRGIAVNKSDKQMLLNEIQGMKMEQEAALREEKLKKQQQQQQQQKIDEIRKQQAEAEAEAERKQQEKDEEVERTMLETSIEIYKREIKDLENRNTEINEQKERLMTLLSEAEELYKDDNDQYNQYAEDLVKQLEQFQAQEDDLDQQIRTLIYKINEAQDKYNEENAGETDVSGKFLSEQPRYEQGAMGEMSASTNPYTNVPDQFYEGTTPLTPIEPSELTVLTEGGGDGGLDFVNMPNLQSLTLSTPIIPPSEDDDDESQEGDESFQLASVESNADSNLPTAEVFSDPPRAETPE